MVKVLRLLATGVTCVLTCVYRLVAGEVSFVAEGCLAAVAFVWLVAVDLKHVSFQRLLLGELGVALVAKVRTVFY